MEVVCICRLLVRTGGVWVEALSSRSCWRCVSRHPRLASIHLVERLPGRWARFRVWRHLTRSDTMFELLVGGEPRLLPGRRLRPWSMRLWRRGLLRRDKGRWARLLALTTLHVFPSFEPTGCILRSIGFGRRRWSREARKSVSACLRRALPCTRRCASRRRSESCVCSIWIAGARLAWIECLAKRVDAHPFPLAIVFLLRRRLAQNFYRRLYRLELRYTLLLSASVSIGVILQCKFSVRFADIFD